MSGFHLKGAATDEDLRMMDLCRDLMADPGHIAGWTLQRDVGEPDRITVRLFAEPEQVDMAMRGAIEPDAPTEVIPLGTDPRTPPLCNQHGQPMVRGLTADDTADWLCVCTREFPR